MRLVRGIINSSQHPRIMPQGLNDKALTVGPENGIIQMSFTSAHPAILVYYYLFLCVICIVVIHAKKRDRCAVQTTAGQAACRFIQLHSRRALFRAVVQNVEQTELGVLYTLKIRNVYRGPCRKEVIYILADNSSMQTVCPYMETNFLYLIGYEMSVMNTNCRGVESVPVGSGASVRAEVLHSSERSTMVIPWRQDMWSFTDECMSARPSRHIPAPPPSSNQLPDHTAQ
eukprot:scpid74371/ scgid0652/ 